jgi:hypothetical protein
MAMLARLGTAVVAVSHNVFSYFLNPLRRSAHAATGF